MPIMQGTPQPRRAGKPLPQIDPQLVADCKAQNPNFGQRRAGPTRTTERAAPAAEPPVQASPPPPAAAPQPVPQPRADGKRPNIVFLPPTIFRSIS
jgi:hypothetical protein